MAGNQEESAMPPAASSAHIAGSSFFRVIGRCSKARETHYLDISNCALSIVPDTVNVMLRRTPLEKCDISGNALARIAPWFPKRFPTIRDLDLSFNRIISIPRQFSEFYSLNKLNLSFNNLSDIPNAVFCLPSLEELNLAYNEFEDFDVPVMMTAPRLKLVNFACNPLTKECRRRIKSLYQVEYNIERAEAGSHNVNVLKPVIMMDSSAD